MEDTSDNYAPDSESPPRNEQEYLAYRIKQLERANRRWKMWILAAVAAAVLFFLLTSGFVFLTGLRARAQEMRALQAAEQARLQAEQRLKEIEPARQKKRTP